MIFFCFFLFSGRMWWWALGILVVLVLVLVFSSKKNQLIIKEVELASSLEVKNNDEFDVVFIGAGLSGISAAHGMITRCQKKVSDIIMIKI